MLREGLQPSVAIADTKDNEPQSIEPIVVRWEEPFRVSPDFTHLPASNQVGDYRAIDVPFVFHDGTATGKIEFVLFGRPPGGHGYYLEGVPFPHIDRAETATLPAHVKAELGISAPIGYADIRLTATNGRVSYFSNRTSECGALGKASPTDRRLYFNKWKKVEDDIDPYGAGVMDLYLPQDPTVFEGVQFQLDRFFVDDKYYPNYPATRKALQKHFGY